MAYFYGLFLLNGHEQWPILWVGNNVFDVRCAAGNIVFSGEFDVTQRLHFCSNVQSRPCEISSTRLRGNNSFIDFSPAGWWSSQNRGDGLLRQVPGAVCLLEVPRYLRRGHISQLRKLQSAELKPQPSYAMEGCSLT